MKKRILFLTDSLSLPRDTPEVVKYEDTYVYQLKMSYPNYEIIQCGFGGATIDILYNQADYLKMIAPDFIILQAGIVDCAPRTLSKFEIDLIDRIPFFTKFIFKIINKYSSKIRRIRNLTYSTEKVYKSTLLNLKKIFPQSNFYCLGILLANKNYELKVPGITNKIETYNQILKSAFDQNYIDTTIIDEKGIMADNFHLNKIGHAKIFTLLKNIIE
jgi:hypothetical protein